MTPQMKTHPAEALPEGRNELQFLFSTTPWKLGMEVHVVELQLYLDDNRHGDFWLT